MIVTTKSLFTGNNEPLISIISLLISVKNQVIELSLTDMHTPQHFRGSRGNLFVLYSCAQISISSTLWKKSILPLIYFCYLLIIDDPMLDPFNTTWNSWTNLMLDCIRIDYIYILINSLNEQVQNTVGSTDGQEWANYPNWTIQSN